MRNVRALTAQRQLAWDMLKRQIRVQRNHGRLQMICGFWQVWKDEGKPISKVTWLTEMVLERRQKRDKRKTVKR